MSEKNLIIIQPFSTPTPAFIKELIIRSKPIKLYSPNTRSPETKPSQIIVTGEDLLLFRAPTGLSVNANTKEATWNTVPGVSGYNIYLSTDGGVFVKQNAELLTDPTFQYSLEDGLYETYVTSQLGTAESEPSDSVSFEVKSVFDFIISQDVNDRIFIQSRETGELLFPEYTNLSPGSRRRMALDGTRGLLYLVGSGRKINQYNISMLTGEITTPFNWEAPLADFSDITWAAVGAAGDLYISGDTSGDIGVSAKRISRVDGSIVWQSEIIQTYAHGGVAPHPTLGVLVPMNFNTARLRRFDTDTGALIDTIVLRDVAGNDLGSETAGRMADPVIDNQGFLYMSKWDDANPGVYRYDPTNFSAATHYFQTSGDARHKYISRDHLIVNTATGKAHVLAKDTLTQVGPTYDVDTPDSVSTSSISTTMIGIDPGNRIYFPPPTAGGVVIAVDALTGNQVWQSQHQASTIANIIGPPGRANPFLI